MTDAALPRAQAIDDTERAPPRRPPPASGGPLRAWIVAALVAAATWASLALSRVEGGVASVWIANGLVVIHDIDRRLRTHFSVPYNWAR